MESVLWYGELVIFGVVYILYFINIHKTVRLISDDNKFCKASYILAAIHICIKLSLMIVPVSKLTGRIFWTMGMPLFCLVIFLSHRKHLWKSVYVPFFYFSVESCSGGVINLLISFFIPNKYQEFSYDLVYLIYNLAYYFVLTRFVVPRKDDLMLSLKMINRKTFLLILGYSFFLSKMTSFIISAVARRPDIDTVFFYLRILGAPVVLLSFFILMMLIVNNMSKFYYKRSAELLDKQIDLQVRYYEKIDEMTTDIRKFRHDYKNHMHLLKSLLSSRKVDDALEYLDSISSDPAMNTNSFKSGNTIADAILNEKAAIAAQENFRLDFSGVISEGISAFDICTILSNALDNSLEACRRLKEAEDRYIEIKCMLKNDMQMISISNPSDTDDPELKTSKENKEEHGMGLYNIRRTVDKLEGTMNIPQTSPVFVLDIMFRVKTPEMV